MGEVGAGDQGAWVLGTEPRSMMGSSAAYWSRAAAVFPACSVQEAQVLRERSADGRQLLRDYAREWLAGRHGDPPPSTGCGSDSISGSSPSLGTCAWPTSSPHGYSPSSLGCHWRQGQQGEC